MIVSRGMDVSSGRGRGLRRGWLFAAVSLVLPCLIGGAAASQETAALNGKTVRVVIGSTPGGVADGVARTFFRYFGEKLPGTTVHMQNLSGSGGAKAVKEIQEAAGDAVTVAFIGNGPVYTQLLSPEKSAYGDLNVKWVGSVMIGQRLLAIRSSLGIDTLDAARKSEKQLLVGASDAQSPSTVETYLMNPILGLRMKVITGVEDDQAIALLLAGSVDTLIAGSSGLAPQFQAGELKPLVKYVEDGDPLLANVAELSKVALPGTPPELIEMMQTLVIARNIVAAAPSTSDADLAALRAAFDAVAVDPKFLEEVKKFNVTNPIGGAKLEGMIDALIGNDAEALRKTVATYMACGVKISDEGATSCD